MMVRIVKRIFPQNVSNAAAAILPPGPEKAGPAAIIKTVAKVKIPKKISLFISRALVSD